MKSVFARLFASSEGRTLQQSLARLVALLTLFAMTVALLVGLVLQYQRELRGVEQTLGIVAGNTANTIDAALLFGDQAAALDALNKLRYDPNIRAAVAYDKEGKLFAAFGNCAVCDDWIAGGVHQGRVDIHYLGGYARIWMPVELRGSKVGSLLLERSTEESRNALLLQQVGTLLVLLLAGGLTIWIGGRWLSVLMQPLAAVVATMREVQHSRQFDRRVPALPGAQDEISALARVFNDMLADLEAQQVVEKGYMSHLSDLVEQRTAALRDEVNERREAENRALAAARAKGEFLSNMSHELRTPLNAVIGLAHLLRNGMTDTKQLQRLDRLQQASESLLALINDILDLSKIEAGKLEVVEEPFALAEMVARVETIASHGLARNKGLAVHFDLDPRLPATLLGDPRRLGQVLINLMGNAVKFTEQGSVTLRVQWLRTRDGRASIRFAVIDTGIGMDAETQARIFKPFEQADAGISRRFGGTGLGLAICSEMLRLMGGSPIEVESTPGQGSSFAFVLELPLAGGQEAPVFAASLTAPARYDLAGVRVLYVEDHPEMRQVYEDLMHADDTQCRCAGSVAEALQVFEAGERFDAVVLDMNLGDGSGLDVVRALRSRPAWGGPLILVVSGSQGEDTRKTVEAAGADGFLLKPVRWQDLRAELGRRLGCPVVASVASPDATPAAAASAPALRTEGGSSDADELSILLADTEIQQLLAEFESSRDIEAAEALLARIEVLIQGQPSPWLAQWLALVRDLVGDYDIAGIHRQFERLVQEAGKS